MSKISKSPERYTFQLESLIRRAEELGEDPDPKEIALYENYKLIADAKEQNPDWQKNNMEYDLRTTDWILAKVRNSKVYAQNLYAAMCNNDFQRLDVMPILTNKRWHCSWRYAGGIISDMREEGDYIDWYCSGIRDTDFPDKEEWNSWTEQQQLDYQNIYSKYVGEGVVTDEIRADLQRLGWAVIQDSLD